MLKINKQIGLGISIPVTLGFIFSLGFILHFSLISETNAQFLKEEKINLALPIHLQIPKINVNANIESVGITSEGVMDSPEGPENVGWFDLGSRPGEVGSAVMAGHSGWKNNQAAVFDDLYKLEKGDKIYVEGEEGGVVTFVVQEIKSYGKDESAPGVFSSSDGRAHLNLVTCTGDWDSRAGSHSNRLVVFADKE